MKHTYTRGERVVAKLIWERYNERKRLGEEDLLPWLQHVKLAEPPDTPQEALRAILDRLEEYGHLQCTRFGHEDGEMHYLVQSVNTSIQEL